MNFKLSVKDFNIVKDVGLPSDTAWCFLIYKVGDEFSWTIGGYDKRKELFRVDMGLCGSVLSSERVVAWKTFDEAKFKLDEAKFKPFDEVKIKLRKK